MHRIHRLQRANSPIFALFCWLAASGCGDGQQPEPAAPRAAGDCVGGAVFAGDIFGSIEASIDWRDDGLDCEGMPRPRGAGARLRFAGSLPGAEQTLAFIVALPELEEGRTARETPAVVTVIDEGSGRFFSNAETSVCWSDVSRQEPLDNQRYAIDGIVYCVAPLPEVNGSGNVAFAELRYSGSVDWSDS